MRSLLALAFLAACAAPPAADPDAAPPSIDPPLDGTIFTETRVTLSPGGGERVELAPITAAQELAQNAARADWIATGRTPLTSLDTICSNSSFWMYDRAGWTGNLICFSGQGSVRLASYGRPVCSQVGCYWGNWSLGAGSLWAGTERGWLIDGPSPFPVDGGGYPQVLFGAWTKGDFQDSGGGRFVYLSLDD